MVHFVEFGVFRATYTRKFTVYWGFMQCPYIWRYSVLIMCKFLGVALQIVELFVFKHACAFDFFTAGSNYWP